MEILTDSLLGDINSIKHGFFTREGGVSEGAYSSLNCSYFRDNKEHVQENRCRAMNYLGKNSSSLLVFTDMYSNKTVIVDKPWKENDLVHADAIVTKNKNVVLGALSADCPVILFADENSQVIGIAHAGWRSAKAGIIESCIEKMLIIGARTENIVASINPCIAQISYEVGLEFYELFINDNANNLEYFKSSIKPDHFMFDIRKYTYNKLKNIGLSHISYINVDTYQDEKHFFSCRRSYHKKENGYGCNLSFIYLK